MKKIFFLALMVLGASLSAQVTTINQNVYGSTVKSVMNTNFSNLQDSVDAVAATATAEGVGTLRDSVIINTTQLQDSLGWFNVLSYGAVGDSVTDDTEAFRSAIAAAGSRKVFVPDGVYRITDSIYTNQSPNIVGVSNDRVPGQSSKIVLVNNKPFLYVDSISGSPYGTGGSVRFLQISGLADTDSTNQHGVVVNANKRWIIEDNTFVNIGGYGVKLGDDYHSVMVTIHRNSFRECLSAVYGRKVAGEAVNAVNIINNHIAYSNGHGIDLIGKSINVTNNIIEFNDSAGVFFDPRTIGEVDCIVDGFNITGQNHFEDNGGGEIFGWHYYNTSGSIDQMIYGLIIEGNTFSTSISYDKPQASAMITFQQAAGSTGGSRMRDLTVGQNRYITSNSTPFVDLNGGSVGSQADIRNDCKVWIPQIDDHSSYFLGLGGASVDFEGYSNAGAVEIYSITAGTGITETMLSRNMQLSLSAAVDISSNPQIVNGLWSTQVITIYGNSDSNTLTLDDGTGLQLPGGQMVLDQYSNITLRWSQNEWVEVSRSVPYWEDITVTGTITNTEVQTNTTQLQDSLGWFNVLSYGAVGDSLTASANANRLAIQAAIDAANHGSEIILPKGDYYIDSTITLNKTVKFTGAGWNDGTTLIPTRNYPIIRIAHRSETGGTYPLGGVVSGFMFAGSNSTDSSNQIGIKHDPLGKWLITRNLFYQLGGKGVDIGDSLASGSVDIHNNVFRENWGQSVYARWKEDTVVNGPDIVNNQFYNNHHHAIDVIASQMQVIDNSIELNDSCGIIFNPMNVVGDCSVSNNVIRGNWFEDNGGGHIFVWYGWEAGSIDKLNYGLTIDGNNRFAQSGAFDKPETTAQITFAAIPTSTSAGRMRDLTVGKNRYISAFPSVDMGGDQIGGIQNDCKLWIPDITASDIPSDFLNLDRASIILRGYAASGFDGISPTAGSGITQAMLTRVMKNQVGAAIDITADPQIEDGFWDGQTITIIGNHNTNTLTLDDGTGLSLAGAASFVIGTDDQITLMYINSDWIEISRSDN